MSDFYKLGVIGQNISYSQSRDIFEAVFRLASVSGSFDVLSVDPDELVDRIGQLVSKGYQGLSVTIPFKSAVIPLLADVEPLAKRLNAVNCIVISDGKMTGHNTDRNGFAASLESANVTLEGRRALIFGHGGSASIAVYSLASDFGIRDFTVVGRSEKKLRDFRDKLAGIVPDLDILIESTEEFAVGFDDRYGLAVNCTPLGGWNDPDRSPLPKRFDWSAIDLYYDLNYNRDNRVIQSARSAGVTAIDGSSMLVAQALVSFHLWSGNTVEFEPVYRAVFGE